MSPICIGSGMLTSVDAGLGAESTTNPRAGSRRGCKLAGAIGSVTARRGRERRSGDARGNPKREASRAAGGRSGRQLEASCEACQLGPNAALGRSIDAEKREGGDDVVERERCR